MTTSKPLYLVTKVSLKAAFGGCKGRMKGEPLYSILGVTRSNLLLKQKWYLPTTTAGPRLKPRQRGYSILRQTSKPKQMSWLKALMANWWKQMDWKHCPDPQLQKTPESRSIPRVLGKAEVLVIGATVPIWTCFLNKLPCCRRSSPGSVVSRNLSKILMSCHGLSDSPASSPWKGK